MVLVIIGLCYIIGRPLLLSSRPMDTIPTPTRALLGRTFNLSFCVPWATLKVPGTEGLATLVLSIFIPQFWCVTSAVSTVAMEDPFMLFPLSSIVIIPPTASHRPSRVCRLCLLYPRS